MEHTKKEISQSEKIKGQYKDLVAECKTKFKTRHGHSIDLDKSKVSRIYNTQFDLLALSEIASRIGIEVDITFRYRNDKHQ